MRDEIDLQHLLLPRGAIFGVGPEEGALVTDGIAIWMSSYGSSRYVMFDAGVAVAALQIIETSPGRGLVAGVYTRPQYRRRGFALRLSDRAKLDFDTIEHAVTMTTDGRAWAQVATRAQPWRHGATTQVVEAGS